MGTIIDTIANYMSIYHIEKKQENDKNYNHMEQIWNKYGKKDLIYIVFILIVYKNLEILY